MIVIPPPVPAPYLAHVPPLSAATRKVLASRKRLTVASRRMVQRELADRRRILAEARRAWEHDEGVRVAPEIPLAD